ncbi:hypothetical protein PENSPDRAFT_694242 [Peniophora sp. CONT]|nr:hypothetical protein PENSPDRAFT_694242 [Peniophora sp. CONT]
MEILVSPADTLEAQRLNSERAPLIIYAQSLLFCEHPRENTHRRLTEKEPHPMKCSTRLRKTAEKITTAAHDARELNLVRSNSDRMGPDWSEQAASALHVVQADSGVKYQWCFPPFLARGPFNSWRFDAGSGSTFDL